MKSTALCLLASITAFHLAKAEVTLDINDDATALVVTVPAGELTGLKLELAYDNSVGAASKLASFAASALRENWANAKTLSESVPAEGQTFTVPLSDLGVPADACFRLFSPGITQLPGNIELLDYVWCNAANAWVDTGVKDTDVYGLELGFCPTYTTDKYPYLFGSVYGGTSGVSIQHNNGAVGVCNGAYFSRFTDGKYTYGPPVSFKTTAMNTCVFRNDSLTVNGSSVSATEGANKWVTSPVGLSGEHLLLNAINDPKNTKTAKAYTKWYYVKFYDSDGNLMLDYLPARLDGVAGFYNRLNNSFVRASGGGALTSGTATNAICQIKTFSRLAKRPAEVTIDKTAGTLTIRVNAGYGQGSKLYLAHGTIDGGDDLAAWSDRLELAASVPAVGGTYTVNLAEAGLDAGRLFRVFVGDVYTTLTRVQQDSADDYIDTGIRDYLVCGCSFGQYCTGYDNEYAAYFGSSAGNAVTDPGFRVWLAGKGEWKNNKYKVCIAEWADGKYTYTMPYVNQNQCNDFRVSNNVITYNGTQVNPSSGSVTWSTFPFATSGLDFHMGRLATIENQHAYGWWYYLTLEDRNGSKLLDYVPVKNAAETAGFFDRVSGSFVTPTGGGALVAGEVAGEAGLVGVSLSDTMTADDQLPITATWKGGASGNLNEAANWACTNALGAELSGVVPRAGVTVVTFCGSLAFDVATAADRIWGSAKILGGSLAGNCDWSAMGEFALDGAFDLAGHSLVLTALPPAGEITSSTTGDPGVLQVTVAEGETIDNVDCALGGNLRFVKDGPGLFVATKTPQTYTGGNDVLAGTLKCGKSNESIDHGGQSCFGDHPSIDVRSGAKLDSAGSYYWGWHKVHLYGGTVMCSVAPSLNFFNPEFYLHEDSFFDAVASCDLQTGIGDLYGHTLTVNVGRDSTFLANWLFNNGTVVITGEGCCKVERSGGVQDCSTATLDISTTKFMQNLTGGLNVSNFIARCTEVTGNLGTPVRVKGRFTPMTLAFPTVQLQDGATLDLSEKTETWSAVSTVAGCSLSFAPNATVTVDTGTGPLTRLRLVSWDAANPPAGVDTLKAISTDRGRKLLVRENGIYVRSGLVILYK